jgi:SOS response regulatory protein OraA/RecX
MVWSELHEKVMKAVQGRRSITHAELNKLLPDRSIDADVIEDIMSLLHEHGIEVVEE